MGVPLRPDPQAMRDQAIASLVRAAAAIGLAALDGTARAPEHARRRFGEDRGLELVLRAAVSPTALAGTPALAHVAYAYLEALVPASAGADLFNRDRTEFQRSRLDQRPRHCAARRRVRRGRPTNSGRPPRPPARR
jgi:hypothetical protein